MPYIVTDEHRLFLNTILDNPDEMFYRQVYADWLEENGLANHGQCLRALASEVSPHDMTKELLKDVVLTRYEGIQSTRTESLLADWIPSMWAFRQRGIEICDSAIRLSGIARMDLSPPIELESDDETLREAMQAYQIGLQRYLHNIGQPISLTLVFRDGMVEVIHIQWWAWMRYFPQLLAEFPIKEVWITDEISNQMRMSELYWMGVHFRIKKQHSECWTVSAHCPAWKTSNNVQGRTFQSINVTSRESYSHYGFGAEWYRLIGKIRPVYPPTSVYAGREGYFQFHPENRGDQPVGVTVDPLQELHDGSIAIESMILNAGGAGLVLGRAAR